jgi:thioredoxin reductase (NADPH)
MPEIPGHFDVIIIGGGPAGLSAGLWCADLGLKAIVLEKEKEFGGQLLWTFGAIKNYLGVESITGRELRDRFLQHIDNTSLHRLTAVSILSVDLAKKNVLLADGTQISGKAMIISTGVRRRSLGVPGEKEFAGRGLLESGSKNQDDVTGKTVVIVGGGDAALENSLILSETAKEVIVVHRRSEFSARPQFIRLSKARDNVRFILNRSVAAIIGNTRIEAVDLLETGSGERSRIAADAVLIRIGVVPNTELFRGQISLDGDSYVEIDAQCDTNRSGVYAIGDVASPNAPTILNAAGQGSVAAKGICNLLTFETERD